MIYTIYLVDNNNSITETISLDVINSFGEDYSSNIAQNPVENGYVISDSISISNPKFSMGGVITDSKFRVSGQLVVFNGNTFVKSQGDNRDQLQQISDDEYAEKVKARLIKLWENKEVFGILESTDINNIKGSKVRNIFPCVLSSLGFNKSDAASAIYPTMSFERIRYAVVTVGTVKNPAPELIPRFKESKENVSSKTTSVNTGVKSEDDKTPDYASKAKAALGNLNGTLESGESAAAKMKLSAEYAVKEAYANAIRGVSVTTLEGSARIAKIHEEARFLFNKMVKEGRVEAGAKFYRLSL